MNSANMGKDGQVDMKLEVVVIAVADVDRAKAFYESLGWRLDADFDISENFRVVQVTPLHSETSIIFGKSVTTAEPGSTSNLVLAVDDVDAARADLLARGINVSEVFHFDGGPFNISAENPRVPGRDPENRTYFSFASFEDPDGNGFLLQEVTSRLPGREWEKAAPQNIDTETLAELLRETAQRHDGFEKAHAGHQWSDWYAPYLIERQKGSTPDAAAAVAENHIREVYGVASS